MTFIIKQCTVIMRFTFNQSFGIFMPQQFINLAMKFLNSSLFIICISFTGLLFSQETNTNEKSGFIYGDLIVKLTDQGNIRAITSRAPVQSKLSAFKELSHTADIRQLKFDYNAMSHESMLNWLYGQPEVELAQNNYYLKMRSTIPNDATFNNQQKKEFYLFN